jgi:hypothetical protein
MDQAFPGFSSSGTLRANWSPMNTPAVQNKNTPRLAASFTALVTIILVAFTFQAARADDVPDRDRRSLSRPQLSGMYKVTASTDPFFPAASDREWFLDFGTGTNQKTSGKVAVSLRQNPSVKVRIMVWQVYPQTGQLLLGNQFGEGSKGAVALADWQISNSAQGVILERAGYQIVLQPAATTDY